MEKKKEKNYRLSLVISILIAACLFVADLYIMINMPQNVLALVAVNVLFFSCDILCDRCCDKADKRSRRTQGRTV